MRNIYFKDQTLSFIEKDYDIVFLGNLYLKGKPYTNPKEAVDKEYVDTAFDNIRTENLKGSKIEDKNFPAFNGDLINQKGKNNFLLKEVIEPGMYHKPTFDSKGRIIGGTKGKLKLTPGDFGGISFDKIVFGNGKGDSIYDWTVGFDSSKYLMINKDNVIDKPLAINTKTIREGHTVLNEDEIMTVSEKYFRGEIGDQKRKDLEGMNEFGNDLSIFNNVRGTPWRFQRNFNKGELRLSDEYEVIVGSEEAKEDKYKYRYYSRRVFGIYENYIFFTEFLNYANAETNELENFHYFEIDSNGKKISDIKSLNVKRHPTSDTSNGMTDKWILGEWLYFLSICYDPNRLWRLSRINIKEIFSGKDPDWERVIDTGSFGWSVSDKYFFLNRGDTGTSAVRLINKDLSMARGVSLPGEVNFSRGDWNGYSHNSFSIGSFCYYIFTFPGTLLTPQTDYYPIELYKMPLAGGKPAGEWSLCDIDISDFPYGYTSVITLKDKVYFLSLSMDSKREVRYSNELVLSCMDILPNGDLDNWRILDRMSAPPNFSVSSHLDTALYKDYLYVWSTYGIIAFKVTTESGIPVETYDPFWKPIY